MKNRTPVPRDQRPPLPDFAPVPRINARHDGWTPERQRAFIEALADTGSVRVAARQVNMSSESAYMLRRQPDAGPFRAAWEAALDMGVQRLKDEAFDRALNGQLVPVFAGGKLLGYRRKKNDRLLMFCLRHYGQDANGERVTINYFAPRGVDGGAISSPAKRRRGTARSVVEGARPQAALSAPESHDLALPAPDPAETVTAFTGVELDAQAQADILAALEACAARRRDMALEDDPEIPYVTEAETPTGYAGELEPTPGFEVTDSLPAGEHPWETLCEEDRTEEIAAAVEAVKKAKASGEWDELPVEPPPGQNIPHVSRTPSMDWRDYVEPDDET